MAMTKWGRKESIIGPPHSPIYTCGAVFMAVILTGLFVYCRFTFGNGPLQRFYTPCDIRSSVAAVIGASRKDNYRMLMMSGRGIPPRLATNGDVTDGKTPEPGGKAIPLPDAAFFTQLSMNNAACETRPLPQQQSELASPYENGGLTTIKDGRCGNPQSSIPDPERMWGKKPDRTDLSKDPFAILLRLSATNASLYIAASTKAELTSKPASFVPQSLR